MRGPCRPQRDSPGAYVVINYWDLPENKTSQSDLLLFISFKQHCFVFGVRADLAACKLVSFFVTVDER